MPRPVAPVAASPAARSQVRSIRCSRPQDGEGDEEDGGADPVAAVEGDGFAASELAPFEGADLPGSLALGVVAESALAAGLGEAYKSEYQPPPLRMKLVPPLMRRCADDCLQLGHRSRGGSVIRCTSSHAWPHAVQAYSYVGMFKSVMAGLALCQVECQRANAGEGKRTPPRRAAPLDREKAGQHAARARGTGAAAAQFALALNGRWAIQLKGITPAAGEMNREMKSR